MSSIHGISRHFEWRLMVNPISHSSLYAQVFKCSCQLAYIAIRPTFLPRWPPLLVTAQCDQRHQTQQCLWLIGCCFSLSVSVGEVHEVHVQPILNRRSVTEFPSVPTTPTTPLSPRSPSTPSFFDDLGSLDPSLYTTIAEVRLCFVVYANIYQRHTLNY